MGVCRSCGGHVQEGFGVAAGMYLNGLCKCDTGSRRTVLSNRGTRFNPTSSSANSSARRISISISPEAIFLKSRRAAREESRSNSTARTAWPFYLICSFGISLIVYSGTIATIKINNETYFGRQNPTDYVGFFGLGVLVLTLLGRNAFRSSAYNHGADAGKNIGIELGQRISAAGKMLEDDIVPVSDRPRVHCSNCTKFVIAGSVQCVWCGFEGFSWECTQCDGVLELAQNGLMYCQNCEDYWRK